MPQRDIGGAGVEQAGGLRFLAADHDAPFGEFRSVATCNMQMARQDQGQAVCLDHARIGDGCVKRG
jgi:hypothetical protein